MGRVSLVQVIKVVFMLCPSLPAGAAVRATRSGRIRIVGLMRLVSKGTMIGAAVVEGVVVVVGTVLALGFIDLEVRGWKGDSRLHVMEEMGG